MTKRSVPVAAPRPAPSRGFKIEHALVACGMASAVASSSFAAFMIAHNTGRPDVHGGQYFTVFAQIDRQQRARAAARAGELEAKALGVDGDVDPIVTGSIGPPRKVDARKVDARKVDPRTGPLAGFSLREVFDGTALVDSPSGVQVVHPGLTLVGAGRVIAIERRAGRMVVVTERGSVVGEIE